MSLPKSLAAARKRAGLTQAQLAKKIGRSAGTVAGWETNRNSARMANLVKVAKVLKTTVAELLA